MEMAGSNSFMTSLLALLDHDKFMKDVESKPCCRTEQVNVKCYLNLVEKILNQAMATVDDVAKNTQPKDSQANSFFQGDQCQSKSSTSLSLETSIPLSSTINELCYQITCKARTNDVHQTMASLFNMLSSFSWDAKAVLTLLALSVYYAEHWRLAQIEESDDLLSITAMLRGSHAIGKSSNTQRIKAFVTLNNLIKVTLEFTKCAVEFMNYSKDFGEFSASIDISARFYYIIVIVLGCSVQFSGLISMSNEFLGQDLWTFSDRVTTKYESFKKEVANLREKHSEQISYEKIKKLSKHCTDIVELMAALFCTKNDFSTVYQCCKRKAVKVEKFKDKIVMLLISDLNLLDEDRETLTSIYSECTFQCSNYKIMWVPIVEEHHEVMQKKFLDKRSEMRWYTSNSIVSKPTAKFIRKKWQFRQQTKVVVLNQQGKVVNIDAMAMIRLWGQEAFPFTESKGQELWNRQGINWFKLVVNNMVFPDVEQSFEREELIFLYGSAEDTQTVQKIEKYLSEINGYFGPYKALNINTKREKFLTRLESCLSLKMQASSDVYDSRAQELLELYTSYKQCGGFAVIARGSSVVINTLLMDFETVLSQHQKWVTQAQAFEAGFKRYYEEVVKKPSCHRFYIPNVVGNIPECIKCAKCSRYMKTAVTFECCHGDQPMRPTCPTPSFGAHGFRDSAVAVAESVTYRSAVAEPASATYWSAVAAAELATYRSASSAPS
ncbi:protein SIEVE ELEMENT OCCLUSION B-like isoform X1 [Syzygium oleosum]|uniref:protein SIEVE ELEMENT OCCLUSION B-like isoform X1 n=1 Tax=Syzygium oleosum TaxID=219896 RepID=UPI0024B8D669|nr:protein SIEVE ELEMENT OCCLUSION B-like isoform X1 [Syzygium oleosum]